MKTKLIAWSAAMVCAIGSTTALAQFSDNFEVDSSANYTIANDDMLVEEPVAVGPDGTVDFGFDYIAAGIPLAPNSMAGDTTGLYISTNDTDNGSGNREEDHYSVFHNTPVNASSYVMTVDMYMSIDTTMGGTTEMASIGIGGDATKPNSIFTPIDGVGHFVSITGDGGSSSDFRHFTPSGTAVPTGDPTYLNSTNTTDAGGDIYQQLFPGGDFPGSPGNRWTTVGISVNPTNVTYYLDNRAIIRTPTEAANGLVSVGLADLFDSVGPHYVVFDNLCVDNG